MGWTVSQALARRLPKPKVVIRLLGALMLLGGLAWDVAVRGRQLAIVQDQEATDEYEPSGGWS